MQALNIEETLKKAFACRVKKELKKIPNAIIFIDEIHSLIGAGSASGGALDAAQPHKPLLSNGELKCMGANHLPRIP